MPIPLKTRILVADDFPIVRSGLRKVLNATPDLEVVAEAEDGAEAVEKAIEEDVHLVILDVSMPRMTGIQAAAELQKRKPELKIVMLSMYDSDQYLLAAARVGASGYVLKSVADEVVVEACRSITRSDRFVYPRQLSKHTRTQLERARKTNRPVDVLTPREREVLKLVAEGHSSADIASLLVISPKTVESHRAHIMEKLAARDRVDLTRYAIRHGLVEP